MLRTVTQMEISQYEGLYDRLIPHDHFLRQINDLVDFTFIIEELKKNYSLDNGRNSECPIRLFKYTLLKDLYPMSDVDVVERSMYDMSFKYFLGYRPEDEVISPSLLTKFRKLRLVDETIMDKLISKTVEIALSLGLIKSSKVIVDSTHSVSRYHNRKPHEVLQEQAKKLRKAAYRGDETMDGKFPAKVQGENLEEHIAYCEKVIEVVESNDQLQINQEVKLAKNYLQEMLDDNLEHIKTSTEEDARVGHKTKDSAFFGFKTHIAMSEEGIITAATVTSGEVHDGKQLKDLIEKSRAAGMIVEAVIGDGAYSEKDNIEYAQDNFELVSKLSSGVVNGMRSKEDRFEYNKDAGMFVCKAGHMAKSKIRRHDKQEHRKENPRMVYYFDIEKCKRCPRREGCYKEGSKSKTYSVSIMSAVQNEHKSFQESERFREMSSKRYKIEAKNGELKNRHGYGEAYGTGVQSMRIQGASTIFIANLKRIVKLTSRKD